LMRRATSSAIASRFVSSIVRTSRHGRVAAGVTTPHPAGHPYESQAEGAASDESPCGRVPPAVGDLPVGVQRVRRRRRACRAWLLPPFGSGDPASDEHERIRRAQRTLLGFVDLLAVEAETRVPKLHIFSVPATGPPAITRVRETVPCLAWVQRCRKGRRAGFEVARPHDLCVLGVSARPREAAGRVRHLPIEV
jgi:hypothetical protein